MSGKKGAQIIRCSHFLAPEHQAKCAWSGRADKYKAHLDEFHGGKDYIAPTVGMPKKDKKEE